MATASTLPDDIQLLARIVQQDHQAFAQLVRRHTERFYRIAVRTLMDREEAEVVVQEAFLKLWEKPTAFDPGKGAAFTTWFYRLVVNLCQDVNRKKRPDRLPEDWEGMDVNAVSSEEMLAHRQEQKQLEHAIQALPERQRLALNLCFYEGISNQEAARIMGVRLKALQSLLMRAKENLRERLWP